MNICSAESSVSAKTPSVDKIDEASLFKKAFGRAVEYRNVQLPLFFKKTFIGEVDVNVNGEGTKINHYQTESLVTTLRKLIVESEIKKIVDLNKPTVTNSDLDFKINYNTEDLKLLIELDPEIMIPVEESSSTENNPERDNAIRASPFGGAVNIKVEDSIDHYTRQNLINANLSSFLNYKSYVLENQSYYDTYDKNGRWRRGDTTIVKDDPSRAITYRLGDIRSQNKGYQNYIEMAGFSIRKNYLTTPYDIVTTSNYNEYILTGKSEVKYYVNGSLFKTSVLDSGKYSIKDIPLNNGLNVITIEITDEFGIKRYLNFEEPYSNTLLKPGTVKYDLSIGERSRMLKSGKTYDPKMGVVKSGFFEKGWSSRFTNSVYGQDFKGFSLFGQESQLSTNYGTFSLGNATSTLVEGRGFANKLDYSIRTVLSSGSTHDFGFGVEERGKRFSQDIYDGNSNRTRIIRSNYSHPFSDLFLFGLGFRKSSVFKNSRTEDTYDYTVNLNKKISRNVVTTLALKETFEFNGRSNQSVAVFINFSLSDSSISTNYNSRTSTGTINYSGRETSNGVTPSSSISSGAGYTSASANVAYRHRLGNLSLKEDYTKRNSEEVRGNTTVGLSTSLVFGYDQSSFGYGLGPPVSDSVLIFKPSKYIRDQKLAFTGETRTGGQGIFGELIDPSLSGYRYKSIQLDPSFLKEGYAIENESMTFIPSYKSVTVREIGSIGGIALKGIMKDKEGKNIPGIVGEAVSSDGKSIQFFTNSGGRFFIDGIPRGNLKLTFPDGNFQVVEISIKDDQMGLLDIGEVILSPK